VYKVTKKSPPGENIFSFDQKAGRYKVIM